MTYDEVDKNLDKITKELGIRGNPTTKEMVDMMFTLALPVGVAKYGLLKTLGAVAGFQGVSMAESKLLGGGWTGGKGLDRCFKRKSARSQQSCSWFDGGC